MGNMNLPEGTGKGSDSEDQALIRRQKYYEE